MILTLTGTNNRTVRIHDAHPIKGLNLFADRLVNAHDVDQVTKAIAWLKDDAAACGLTLDNGIKINVTRR